MDAEETKTHIREAAERAKASIDAFVGHLGHLDKGEWQRANQAALLARRA